MGDKVSGDKKFIDIIDANGNAIECEVLFLFEDNETSQQYIVYASKYPDQNQNREVFASEMKKEGSQIVLNNDFSDRAEVIIAALMEAINKLPE